MGQQIQGKIIKGIAGFYYVYTKIGLVECKAKGIFRKDGMKPLVGDDVCLEVLKEGALTGSITAILERRNMLIRPACANIDQALVIFAVTKPDPNYNLLDRFLIMMEKQQLPSVICFNKSDLAGPGEQEELRRAYGGCGSKVLFVSADRQEGIEEIKSCLAGRTTAVAGPSGVGKSTIINTIYPEAHMETGEISRKIDRGRHTTRHSELFALGEATFLMDTPGFTSLNVEGIEKEELSGYYPEFAPYEAACRFGGCAHINEPDCGVKQALIEGKISQIRYENYKLLYEELKSRRKY